MSRVPEYHVVFLCLGSNVGDRARFLKEAIARLSLDDQITDVRCSAVLENPPLFFEDQGPFLNQIVRGRTAYSPRRLLGTLKELEVAIGRTPTFRNGPREIDLDILAFEGSFLQTPDLVLPHPGLLKRPFLRTLLSDLGTTPENLEQGRFT